MVIDERPAEDLVYEIEPEVQEQLLQHPGKWAALTASEVIAVRDSPTDALAAAREAGVETPILYQIPDTRSGYSYF
jgi:hypothetical protein